MRDGRVGDGFGLLEIGLQVQARAAGIDGLYQSLWLVFSYVLFTIKFLAFVVLAIK